MHRVYRSLQEFQSDWIEESQMTQKMMSALTNESLSQRVTESGRSLGFIAWHIVDTVPEMMGHAGLNVPVPEGWTEQPSNAIDIAAAYEHVSRALLDRLSVEWNDDMIAEEVDMYGERWARGRVLYALVLHQVHHRGQMSVLMRQAGLAVPGMYGPSSEEWTAMGVEPMK